MTQEKKVQTAAVMDVTGVERAAQDAVRAATRMAEGIAREGEKAGKGLEAMGDGAEKAERTVDAATKSISDRIRRLTRESQRELSALAATSAGGAGSASAVEYEATLRGANVAQLQPRINALRELQKVVDDLQRSMKQAAAGEDLIKSLNDRIGALQKQSQGLKMAEADMLALKAAELGVAQQAEPLIAQMRELQAAAEKSAAAAREEADAQRKSEAVKRQLAASQEDFTRGLREQMAVMGKSADEILRYRAAQLGIAEAAAPLILQLQNMRAAQEAAAQAAREEAEAQRQAAAEKKRAASAQDQFISGLREQAATQGMTQAEALRYRATLLNVSGEAEQYIAQLEAMDQAAKSREFVQGIEARTAALMNQAMALQRSEADMLEWQAAQRGLSKDAAPAIEALRNQTAALEAARREASGKDFLSGLSAQTNALGKTRADLLEMKAAQLGVAEAAAPMIKAIREADGEMTGMGRQAKEMQWAMRGLPAQFTDIWVSLASGQSPMMVFIQQGGQLKDMFGGVGPAAQAMGRYVVGLVNPFTLAAAAAGVLFAAYKSGSDEITKLSQAVILSGERLGVTADQLQEIAESVAALGIGTQGAASEFLGTIAKDAKVATADLQRFTAAAINMERSGGPAAEETAKAFSELGKDPLQASIKLTAQYNYLTQAAYQQIKALEDQGRTTEAAAVAQRAYAEFLEQRAPRMEAALGVIERAWKAVATATAKAWDNLKQFGRDATMQEQYSALAASIKDIESGKLGERAKGDLPALREQLNELRKQVELQQAGAIAAEQRSRVVQATAEWDKRGEAFLSNKLKMEREIAQERRIGLEANKSEADIAKRIAEIREKYRDKSVKPGDPFASDREAAKEWADFYVHFADAADKAEGKVAELTDAQVKLVQFLSAPAYQKMDEPARQLVLQEAYRKIAADQAAAAQKEWAESVRESEREYNKLVEAMENSAENAEKQLATLEIENRARALAVASGMDLKDAIEQITIARLEERRVVLEAAGNEAAVAAIDREIEARKKLAVEVRRAAVYDAEKKRAEEIRKEYEKLSDSITDALMRGFENGKDFARNFRETVANMFKTMVLRPIIQAVVNPVAMALTGAMGMSSGASAAATIAGQAGGGTAGVMQSLGNLYSSITGAFDALGTNVAMAADKIGEWLVLNTSGVLNKAGGTLMQYAGQIGSFAQLAGGAAASLGLKSLVGGQYEVSKGVSTVQNIGVLATSLLGGPVIGSLAGAAAGLFNRAFGRGPKTTTASGIEGTFGAGDATGNSFNEWVKKGGWFRSDKRGTDRGALDADMEMALDAGAAAVYAQTAAYADALGLPAEALAGITSSFRVKFTADAEENKKAVAAAIADYGAALGDAYADVLRPLQRFGENLGDTLGRIATLQTFSENLNQLGGVFSRVANLGIDVRESFIEMAGGMDALMANAMSFAQNYYTRDEIAGLKAGEIQQALLAAGVAGAGDITGREDFRRLVEAVDVSTESGREQLATLLSVQAAFVDVADYLAETGGTLAQAATRAPEAGAVTSLISPMQQQTDATRTLTSGMGVLHTAINKLTEVIRGMSAGQGTGAAAPAPAPALANWPTEVFVYENPGGA